MGKAAPLARIYSKVRCAWTKRSLSRDVPQFRSYRVVDGRRSLLSGCRQINVWQSKVRKTRRGGSRRISPSARAIAQVIESDAQKEAPSATVSRLKLRASSRRLTSDQRDWTQNHLGRGFYFVGARIKAASPPLVPTPAPIIGTMPSPMAMQIHLSNVVRLCLYSG